MNIGDKTIENSDSNDESRIIILDLKPQSKVISFKIEEDAIAQFDKYIRILGIRSRSFAIKRLIYAFINAVEKYLRQQGIDKEKIKITLPSIAPDIVPSVQENRRKEKEIA